MLILGGPVIGGRSGSGVGKGRRLVFRLSLGITVKVNLHCGKAKTTSLPDGFLVIQLSNRTD